MISNHVLQTTIDGLKKITRAKLHVFDVNGNLLATTEPRDGEYQAEKDAAVSFAAQEEKLAEIGDLLCLRVCDDGQFVYVLVVKSKADAQMIGNMAVFQLQGLLVAYKERLDKETFLRNLLLDNLLLVDVYAKAKLLHIKPKAPRAVFLTETVTDNDTDTLKRIRLLFSGRTHYFVTVVSERSIAVVQRLSKGEGYEQLEQTAREISRLLGQNEPPQRVACGTIVDDLREVSRSYKEAKMALEIGKIFYEEETVVAYNTLGIGRLIYQLPLPLCRMFISEIFGDMSPDDFDKETLTTICAFFENNLNVSVTSRQLFIHRNTLVYRLEKIKRMTGLDLHSFEDAITFKIGLMVAKYMNYMESQDF